LMPLGSVQFYGQLILGFCLQWIFPFRGHPGCSFRFVSCLLLVDSND
jgi:hypothetical protein